MKHYIRSDYYKLCCVAMENNLNDFRIPLDLDLSIKRFFIPLMWPHTGVYTLYYCPWCGCKLPDSEALREKMFEILDKEYGITDLDDSRMPEEFTTEEWWINRGL